MIVHLSEKNEKQIIHCRIDSPELREIGAEQDVPTDTVRQEHQSEKEHEPVDGLDAVFERSSDDVETRVDTDKLENFHERQNRI
eukprot:gene933-biopygen9369